MLSLPYANLALLFCDVRSIIKFENKSRTSNICYTMRSHALNLMTGIFGCCYVINCWITCDSLIASLAIIVLITTIVFHGTHVLGFGQFANDHIMKYDVTAVFTSGFILCAKVPHDQRFFVYSVLFTITTIWLSTFHPFYKKIPLNPVASLIHLVAIWLNSTQSAVLCKV